MSSVVTIETSITIHVEQSDGLTAVLTLTLEEARALKDELIRAVGAQNPVLAYPPGVRDGFAPVLQPKGGFLGRGSTLSPDTRGGGVLHPSDRKCHCGDPGWGSNGACGTSGCNNVPA